MSHRVSLRLLLVVFLTGELRYGRFPTYRMPSIPTVVLQYSTITNIITITNVITCSSLRPQ